MLYLIGLGLGDEEDITLRGLKAVQSCDKVFLEAYTSILGVDKANLEKLYGKEIIVADRDLVEQGSDQIIEAAKAGSAALLVVGDPFG
jgi:diphthine methyl ester synthase